MKHQETGQRDLTLVGWATAYQIEPVVLKPELEILSTTASAKYPDSVQACGKSQKCIKREGVNTPNF